MERNQEYKNKEKEIRFALGTENKEWKEFKEEMEKEKKDGKRKLNRIRKGIRRRIVFHLRVRYN